MNVGIDHIKLLVGRELAGIASADVEAVRHSVELSQLAGVVGRVGLNFDSDALSCAVHERDDGKDSGSAAHVKNLCPFEVGLKYALEHEVGRWVVPRSKGHFRNHLHRVAVVGRVHALVKGSVDKQLTAN